MRRLNLARTITAITFIAVFAMATRVVVDSDTYWHLAAGRYIVETRQIPAVDPFSWTMRGQPWIDIYWLAQTGLYLVYTWLGTSGLSLFVAVVATLSLVFIWKQLSGPVFARALIVVLVAAASGAVWTARPHLLTYLFTAIVAYLLYLYQWRQIDRLWLLPLICVLWVNVHGGYVVGFMLLGTLIAGEAIENVAAPRWRTADPAVSLVHQRRWRKLIGITVLSGLALLINPYTSGALTLPLKTVGISTLQLSISEWASPNFHELFQQPMIWLLLLTLLAIGRSGRRLDSTDALRLALFAYMAFWARRNIGLFALVCAPILSRHIEAWWAQSPWPTRRLSRGQPIVNAALIGLVILAALLKVALPLTPTVQAQAERELMPLEAVDWIVQHQPDRPMFNSYNWGGYLLWRLWPDYPVYVDGRTDLYDDDFLRDDYLDILLARPGFQARLDRRGIGFVIVEANSVLDTSLPQTARWREAYRDKMAVIYVRG